LPFAPDEPRVFDFCLLYSKAILFQSDRNGTSRIRILPLSGGDARDVIVKGWSNLQFIDAASGPKCYSSSRSATSITLLYIDLQGHAQTLSENVGSAVPSPDGRHVALLKME
jgi:hypothetical protein